jgi:hypothetical protein
MEAFIVATDADAAAMDIMGITSRKLSRYARVMWMRRRPRSETCDASSSARRGVPGDGRIADALSKTRDLSPRRADGGSGARSGFNRPVPKIARLSNRPTGVSFDRHVPDTRIE